MQFLDLKCSILNSTWYRHYSNRKGKTFDLFFEKLQEVINLYNLKNPDDKHDFSIKRVVKFLSDQGIAEQSFYQNQNLHHCWCTCHLTGSSGAFSALAQIESEIFMILDSTTWERKREEFYNRLKEEAINPNCPQKQKK